MRPGLILVNLLTCAFASFLAAESAPRADEPHGRSVAFSGYDWQVKVREQWGPGPNRWSASPSCVRVDDRGHLHLRIVREQDRWSCAEVVIPRSLGYGSYRWVIAGDLAKLDAQTVLGLFTYEDKNHEIDFELGRWGQPNDENCQFVVQPAAPDSIHRFDAATAQVLTCEFTWTKSTIEFRCWAGADDAAPAVSTWTYSGPKIPTPGREAVHMNLWLLKGKASPEMRTQEVTVQSFRFRPALVPTAP